LRQFVDLCALLFLLSACKIYVITQMKKAKPSITLIKHSLEKCRKHEPQASVFHISLVFSNAHRVLSQCNTRLRLLYLLSNRMNGSTIKDLYSDSLQIARPFIKRCWLNDIVTLIFDRLQSSLHCVTILVGLSKCILLSSV